MDSVVPGGSGSLSQSSPRARPGNPDQDHPAALTEGCRVLRERIENWQTSQTARLTQEAEDTLRSLQSALSTAQSERTSKEQNWSNAKEELAAAKEKAEAARSKLEEAVEKREAAVRVVDQARKECNDKEAAAAQAEIKRTELLARMGEQLLGMADELESKPVEILRDLGKWHEDKSAELGKLTTDATEAEKASESAREKLTEAERSLEAALPGLERGIEVSSQTAEEAAGSVLEATQRENQSSAAFQEADLNVPKAERAVEDAQRRKDELVAEGEHLSNVVDLLQNSLKALSNLRPR